MRKTTDDGTSTPPPAEGHAALPCPDWCALEPGHPFHSIDPESGALTRDHERDFGPYVAIYAEEQAITDEGPLWLAHAPRIMVMTEGPFTADQAQRLVCDLAEASTALADLS